MIMILILNSIASVRLHALTMSEREQQLSDILTEELKEISRINKQTQSRNPTLLLRMAELLLEKGRLIKEAEHDSYMSLDESARKNISIKDQFEKSRKYFEQAQKTCFFILKKFPSFNDIGVVYYILAYNAKEFYQLDTAKKYFSKSLNTTQRGTLAYRKAQEALAELYYNTKEYRKAIPLYEASINAVDDKWWTKDAFNLAWCYYRTNRFNEASSLMEAVFRKSKDLKYIDLSSDASRDLAYFYAAAGKVNDAIKFFQNNNVPMFKRLFNMGGHLVKNGDFDGAEKTYYEAEKYVANDRERADLWLAIMNLYDKGSNNKKHLAAMEKLKPLNTNGVLTKDEKGTIVYQAQSRAARLQQQVIDKRYQKYKDELTSKANDAVMYLQMMAFFDSENDQKHLFHAGETYYAIKQFDKAIQYYDQANASASVKKDIETMKLASNGLIASLGEESVSKQTKDKYIEVVYKAFLKSNPKSQKSFMIYQRLFNINMEKKNVKDAEANLFEMHENFPSSHKEQEIMLAKIMDHYKNANDRDNVIRLAGYIKNGTFSVSSEYSKKVNILLLTMQFENVEKASSRGDKILALQGFIQIYQDANSTPEAKVSASYNVAVTFYELGDGTKNYQWLDRALDHMQTADVLRFEESILNMSKELFDRRLYKESAAINVKTLDKLCSVNTKTKKSFYKNAMVIYTALSDINSAEKLSVNGVKCNIPKEYRDLAFLDYVELLERHERWSELERQIDKNFEWVMAQNLIRPLYNIYKAYVAAGRTQQAVNVKKRIVDIYRQGKEKQVAFTLDSLDVIASFEIEKVQQAMAQVTLIQLKFPEKVYNELLQKKLKCLDDFTLQALQVLKIGSGRAIVRIYKYLIETYDGVAVEIEKFTPPDKGPEYVTSFKKSMMSIVDPIRSKVQEFKTDARNTIMKNDILSDDNQLFFESKLPLTPRYFYIPGGIVMDKGGAK